MRSIVAFVLAVLSIGLSNNRIVVLKNSSRDKDAQDTMRHLVYMCTIVSAYLNG